MPDLIDALAHKAGVGPAAPAGNSKQQPGTASPAGNGTDAGKSSPAALDAALIAEKKQHEHWKNKYERDIGDVDELKQRMGHLEGLAQGLSLGHPAPSQSPKTFADLDKAGLDEVVKRAMEEGQHGLISSAMEEYATRAAAKAAKEAEERASKKFQGVLAAQQVAARVTNEFGADVMNESSDLRQRADYHVSRMLKANPQALEQDPENLYRCFAQADRELHAGEKSELERLRKADAERLAREEIERSRQTIQTKAKDDVKELLEKNDITGAIKARFAKFGRRI